MDIPSFKRVIALLEQNSISYWVYGGFALDGIRGEITREHGDVDLYVATAHIDRLRNALHADGLPSVQRRNMFYVESPAVKIGIVRICEEQGRIIAYGNKTIHNYPRSPFLLERWMTLEGIAFRVAPNEALKFEAQYSKHAKDKEFGMNLPVDAKEYGSITHTIV